MQMSAVIFGVVRIAGSCLPKTAHSHRLPRPAMTLWRIGIHGTVDRVPLLRHGVDNLFGSLATP